MHTPEAIARDNIAQVPLVSTDSVLDAFKGNGVYYNQIPNVDKTYCEIEEDKDFFKHTEQVDWIISNPPFQIYRNNKRKNALNLIVEHSVRICRKGFGYLINHNLVNSLTVKRLRKWQGNGFCITSIKVYEISKWYGRYYFIVFERDKKSILDF